MALSQFSGKIESMDMILRPVRKKDFDKILDWRNNSEVRRQMLNPKVISWEEHEKFWEEFLKDDDKRAYIVVHNNIDCGVIRLEKRDSGVYEVAIIIDPEYHGRGIAKNALRLLVDKIKETDIYIYPNLLQELSQITSNHKNYSKKQALKKSSSSTKENFDRLKVAFMGGKQAGCVGLLTMYASHCNILGVVAYDEFVKMLAEHLNIPIFTTIADKGFINALRESDLLVSVHGWEIVPKELLELPRLGCINAHPCLYKYKGANPVERLLKDGNTKASVGVHYMIEKVDAGEVIVEEFVNVEGKKTVEEVYNQLYPYYAVALLKALTIIKTKNRFIPKKA